MTKDFPASFQALIDQDLYLADAAYREKVDFFRSWLNLLTGVLEIEKIDAETIARILDLVLLGMPPSAPGTKTTNWVARYAKDLDLEQLIEEFPVD